MFENMTPRERLLARIVLALLPLMALLLAGTWYSRVYFGKRARVAALRQQISNEKRKQLDGQLANQRRAYYRSISLPSDLNRAKSRYQGWLSQLAKENQFQLRSLDPLPVEEKKYNGRNQLETVYRKLPFTLRARCTYDQLIQFMLEFYQTDLLQRIHYVSIIPKNVSKSGKNANVRSGVLEVEMRIDVISLVDADRTREGFLEARRPTPRDVTEYKDKIANRNVFGPANNPPTLSYSRSRRYEAGKPISLGLTGRDADANDQLTFELVDSPVEGTRLSQATAGSRTANLSLPPLEAGEYGPIRVRVTDNGLPPKSSEETITIKVNPPKPPVVKEPKPKPKFAGHTTVSGIVREKDGKWKVILRFKMAEKSYQKLTVGQTFELDDSTWIIRDIQPHHVTIENGEEWLTYNVGDELDQPHERKPKPESQPAKSDFSDSPGHF